MDPLEVKKAKVDKYMKQMDSGKWEVIIDGMRDRESISKQVKETVFPV